MKGIVFNLLESVVSEVHGADTWDALLDAAAVDGAYTSLGNYADEDFLELVRAASVALCEPVETVVRWFGRQALPLLAQRYPQFFVAHTSLRPFLLTLNDVIHPEVRKLYPGAEIPDFDFRTCGDDELLMGYRSVRRLCAFAEGLIEGAAAHFGQQVSIRQTHCMLRGDPECVLQVAVSRRME